MQEWKRIRNMPPLEDFEDRVLGDAATEPPHSGRYDRSFGDGLYVCRRCGLELYLSENKFDCGCGWPAFDDAVPEAVTERPDQDGRRTEIVCANCCGHLGHIFRGERLTETDVRHCVNSASIYFLPAKSAFFAGGCFWGVEHLFKGMAGVLLVLSGYTGGKTSMPTYREVCTDSTGHAETVLVKYDPGIIGYRALVQGFFEIHDPTQLDRQGPDYGTQYRSAIFYNDEAEKVIAKENIDFLKSKGVPVVTQLLPAGRFYPAEGDHQNYFGKNPERLAHTCHVHQKIDWGV